MSILYTD